MGIDSPKVTVIIPVFNGDRYLSEAIESILRQTYTNFELLIINDGSTDRSSDIISSYADKRIRVITNPMNYGLTKTRNIGLCEARGEYLAMLDCDDVALPHRLREQLNVMEGIPELGLLGSWAKVLDETGRRSGVIWRFPLSAELIPITLLFMNYFIQSSVMVRKVALPSGGYRDDYPAAEDYDLFVRVAEKWKVWNIQKPLVYYRLHASNISAMKKETMENCIRKVISGQLEKLEIFPAPHDMAIHRRIGVSKKITNMYELEMIEAWLLKLSEANLKSNRYPPTSFENVIGQQWYKVCYCATAHGLVCWKRFNASPLRKLSNFSVLDKAKLAIKCATKRDLRYH